MWMLAVVKQVDGFIIYRMIKVCLIIKALDINHCKHRG